MSQTLNQNRTPSLTTPLSDSRVNVKVVLSGLWVAMLFVFAYVDIFGSLRADMVNGALAGKLPVTGFTIDQSFLVYTLLYILIPSLMVVVSLMAPARVNRIANLVAAPLYAISIAVAAIGEQWAYYLIGSAVEVLLLTVLVRTAWAWPRRGTE